MSPLYALEGLEGAAEVERGGDDRWMEKQSVGREDCADAWRAGCPAYFRQAEVINIRLFKLSFIADAMVGRVLSVSRLFFSFFPLSFFTQT